MSDPTAARDRAIRVVAESLGEARMGRERRLVARVAVDTLLANPEVLRALAGAPDVTAHRPDRNSDVAAWIKRKRDAQLTATEPWYVLDGLLDDYRLRADTGTPLTADDPEEGAPC